MLYKELVDDFGEEPMCHECWVLEVGYNDTADSFGASIGMADVF
jgi:hypothetical protein